MLHCFCKKCSSLKKRLQDFVVRGGITCIFTTTTKNKHDKFITAKLKKSDKLTNIEKYRVAAYKILRNILLLKIKNHYLKDHDNRVKIMKSIG